MDHVTSHLNSPKGSEKGLYKYGIYTCHIYIHVYVTHTYIHICIYCNDRWFMYCMCLTWWIRPGWHTMKPRSPSFIWIALRARRPSIPLSGDRADEVHTRHTQVLRRGEEHTVLRRTLLFFRRTKVSATRYFFWGCWVSNRVQEVYCNSYTSKKRWLTRETRTR